MSTTLVISIARVKYYAIMAGANHATLGSSKLVVVTQVHANVVRQLCNDRRRRF